MKKLRLREGKRLAFCHTERGWDRAGISTRSATLQNQPFLVSPTSQARAVKGDKCTEFTFCPASYRCVTLVSH
jgi:hypothetical protein